MRYMMLIYSKETPGGMSAEQREELIARHTRTITEARKKGVLEGAEPLGPVSTATTVRVQEDKTLVTDGPFAETKELVAGFWLWEVKDMDEAVAWVKRCPNPMPGPSEIEIRPLYEMADFSMRL